MPDRATSAIACTYTESRSKEPLLQFFDFSARTTLNALRIIVAAGDEGKRRSRGGETTIYSTNNKRMHFFYSSFTDALSLHDSLAWGGEGEGGMRGRRMHKLGNPFRRPLAATSRCNHEEGGDKQGGKSSRGGLPWGGMWSFRHLSADWKPCPA